jgi:hypothetical protein
VGGVDVAVAVEQVIGAGHGGRERAAGAGVGAAGLLQKTGGVAQVAGDDGSQVGGFGQPPAPALPGGAELGGAQQLGDSADGVAAPQVGVRDLLKERGDPFVGFLGGLGQGARRVVRASRPGRRRAPRGPAAAARWSTAPRSPTG